jgi:integrase
MAAYRPADKLTYMIRVDAADGRHAVLSTECRDKGDADDMQDAVNRWRGRRGKKYARPDVIDALVDKRIKLATVFEAHLAGTLDELLEQHPATGVDLAAHLTDWIADVRKRKRGAGQADTYEKQIRVLYPQIAAAAFTLDLFTRKELWARLDALDVEGPTKNRYRAAASSFAKYLTKREIIERNFVRDIGGFGESDPRLVYYEVADAKRLIERLPQPYAAIAAAAFGFCMEWGAIARATVGDFDLKPDPPLARVRGTKRSWRDRHVPLVKELAWIVPYLAPALARKAKSAFVFDEVPEWRAIDVQRAEARAAKPRIRAIGEKEFGEHSLHDWRHTHAVALLRFGYDEQIVANHEGHKNTTLVRERYGRFKPTRHDYAKVGPSAPHIIESATDSATIPLKRKGKR